MRYISPDDKNIGFAAGEDVTLRWVIYEDSSRKVEYRMREDDVITFVIRRGASPNSEVLVVAESEPGSNEVVFYGADTGWLRPGQYTAIAVISIPSRDISEMMIWPPIDHETQGVFPVGNCLISAGGKGVFGHGGI